jgi:protoporphyrinogen oxidase
MKNESVHTLILGAGPSGLTAGYLLAKAGKQPVVLERDRVSGGLMRSIRHGDFILDVGRKELYNRLARVDEFWSEILGDDYRVYQHRGGLLFDGHVVDMSPSYRGVRRGLPWTLVLPCAVDLLSSRFRSRAPPRNLEEYWCRQRGRALTQITNQGFQEKLAGTRWVDVPIAPTTQVPSQSLAKTVRQAVVRTLWAGESNSYRGMWKHPAKGTGQICESLERGIVESGGRVIHQAQILTMAASAGTVRSVTANVGSEAVTFNAGSFISSTSVEFLHQVLVGDGIGALGTKNPQHRRRVIVLVYLFVDEVPRFPHFWLQVTCPKIKVGRITNYAALNGDMVPKGKTCLCCEYYCFDADAMLDMDDTKISDFALDECARSGLLTPTKCFDRLVLKFPGADASQNRRNWFSKQRQQTYADLRQFRNLYPVNRTDLDIATLAGIESAEAVLCGDRALFDLHFDPRELDIRSESKPFEFRTPVGVEA